MKKFINIIVFLTILLNMNLISFADDRPFLLLNDEFYVDAFSANTDIQDLYFEDNALKLTFVNEGRDPTLAIPLALMGDINCSEYKVLAIKMKAPQPGSGGIYFATDSQPSLNEDKNVPTSEYVADGDWHIVTVDLGQNENYNGYVSYFRFDPYPKGVDGTLEIQWFGMFRDVQEALNYEGAPATPEVTPSVTPKKSIVPNNGWGNDKLSGDAIAIIVLISVFAISTGLAVIISIIHLKKSQNF